MYQLNAIQSSIALAVLALLAWTFVILLAMEISRAVAMRRSGLRLQVLERGVDAARNLPRWTVNISDNYNHLLEAPIAFYAVALLAIACGTASATLSGLAWAFVALRIAHSIVQCSGNRVVLRFPLFIAAWFAVIAMVGMLAVALLQGA